MPCGATTGSATPSSLTRRSMVCSACCTDSFAELDGHVRPHLEGIRAARAGRAVVKAGELGVGELTECLILRRRHPGQLDLRRRLRRDRDAVDALAAERRAQALGCHLRLEPEGIVGLHAQDQVNAPLQVEPEFDLAGLAGRVERRPEGDDGHDHDGEDGQYFPAEVLRHDSGHGRGPGSATTATDMSAAHRFGVTWLPVRGRPAPRPDSRPLRTWRLRCAPFRRSATGSIGRGSS